VSLAGDGHEYSGRLTRGGIAFDTDQHDTIILAKALAKMDVLAGLGERGHANQFAQQIWTTPLSTSQAHTVFIEKR
jgi:hypothetical protein